MYQITGQQISFRVNEEERNELNEFAKNWQTDENTVFSNGKQVVFALLAHCKQLESKLETLENIPLTSENTNENINKIKQQLIEALAYEATPEDEELFKDLLEIITTPLEPLEPVEIIKTVEVEKQLAPGEIILDLTPRQSELLELISAYRARLKDDVPRKTVQEIIKQIVFNKYILTNEFGIFKTYIKPKTLQ